MFLSTWWRLTAKDGIQHISLLEQRGAQQQSALHDLGNGGLIKTLPSAQSVLLHVRGANVELSVFIIAYTAGIADSLRVIHIDLH